MTTVTRRNFVTSALTAPIAVPSLRSVRAQTATMKLVVPVPPGGTLDPIARVVQAGLQQRLGVTVVVENKPGASGSIGTAQVAKSAPDGNTLLFVYETHAINPLLMSLPFDSEKDLEPVQLIATAPAILAKHSARPWKDLSELIAAAKEKPNSISYATTGSGSIGHLAMTVLTDRAGIQMIHTPYRGGGPAMNDVIAGHVDTVIGSVALRVHSLEREKLEAF
jgi:tripartite-type tricarboxylate transporter receptor subunit TctC